MKKRLYALTLLALIGVGMSVVAGCDIPEKEETPEYTVSITNKDELQEEWRYGDSSRSLQVEITHLGEVQNPVSAIATGELSITSSNTEVITTSGAVLVVAGVGKSTVTATYNDVSDSVSLEVLETKKTWTDWEVGNKYALGYDKDGVTWYYDGGVQNNYYGTVSTNPDDAVAVLVEASGSGYSLKLDNGFYLGGSFPNGYVDFEWTLTSPYVWDYDSELETFITTNGGTTYALGTTSSYDEITLVDASSTVNYFAHLYTLSENAGAAKEIPEPANWSAGNKYALGYEKGSNIYYYNGKVQATYYGDVSTNVGDAVAVLVEEYNSGYSLKLDNGYYLGFAVSDGHHNFKWDLTSAYEWTYDEELNTFLAYDGEAAYFMGTYTSSDKSYDEIQMVKLESDDILYMTHLYELGETTSSSYGTVLVSEYQSGSSYLLGIDTGSARYYGTGTMSSYYGATTTDYTAAVNYTITDVDGGVNLSCEVNGATKYVTLVVNDTHLNLTYADTPQRLTYDKTYNTFTLETGLTGDGAITKAFLGTYGDYTTLGWYNYNYISNSGEYPAHLYEIGEEESGATTLPDPAEWSVGNKYALGYQKGNAMHYYDGGVLQSFYGSVTSDLSKAAPVLVEAASEGYSLKLENGNYLGYAYELGNNGSYHNDFKWDLNEPFVWTYDESLNTFVTVHENTTYAMGTSSSYDEITMVDVSNSSNYIAHLYDLAN